MLGLFLGLWPSNQTGTGGGNENSDTLTDESTNILQDESGNNLESSGA